MLNDYIFTKAAFSKCLIQDIEWENMKCCKCNVLLVDDPSSEKVDVKICPVCGEKHLRIKRI